MNPIALLLGFLTASALAAEAAEAAERPNIVFCFADDWGRYAGAYAKVDGRPSLNQVIKTPNIDRMAGEGALFRRAFVTSPSCTPCRSSLLSGQYFFRTHMGAILNGAEWDASIPTYPLMLREAGYHIGKSYKVWSPGKPADAPYGGQKYAYQKSGGRFNNFSENATEMVQGGATFADAKSALLAEVRSNFQAFLADRKDGKPFCYWFGPTLTHRAFQKHSGANLWGINPDDLKGKLPAFLPDVPEVRDDVADYMGEAQAWDAGIGVLIAELEQRGELDKTLIVISGDHGMPGVPSGKCNLFDHGTNVALIVRGPGVKSGRVIDDFVNLMDLAPTFLELGGVQPPAVMTGRSIVPLLNSPQAGQIDATRSWVITGRERHVSSAREDNLPYPHRALRTKEFLYVRNFAPDRWPLGSPKFTSRADLPKFEEIEKSTSAAFADMDASPTKAWVVHHFDDPQHKWVFEHAFGKRPAEELYDLAKDPDQIRNVAADPAYAAALKQMSTQLLTTLQQVGDPRVGPSPVKFEFPPFTLPGK
jgi:arylsulfatase A-like enzyme